MSLSLLPDLSNKQIILYNKIKTDVDKLASTSQAKISGFNDAQFPSAQDRVQVSQLNFLIRSFLEVFNYLDDLRDQMQNGFQNISLGTGQLSAYSQKVIEDISALKNNMTRLENQIGLKPTQQTQPVTLSPEVTMIDRNQEKDWYHILMIYGLLICPKNKEIRSKDKNIIGPKNNIKANNHKVLMGI